ncbi:MAG: DUF4198 domain-containing protein [Pseudomonadota bacterium]
MTRPLRLRPGIAACLLLIGLAAPLSAHEFWIAPQSHRAEVGTKMTADLRVGQDMQGEVFPWLRRSVITAQHWTPSGAVPLKGREGDIPALSFAFDEPGLHRITFHAAPAYINFDNMEKFQSYLTYEGLTGIVEAHRARGLPEEDFAEGYIRNARALVQVGPASADQLDTPTGMPFELVAVQNPFVDGTTAIDVALTWQGQPSADTQVAIFVQAAGTAGADNVTRTLVKTDAGGIARVPFAQPGTYLLAAVHMEPFNGTAVFWESHWATLTFDVRQ